jgi:hypothetical protein
MIGDPDANIYGAPNELGRTTVGLHILVDTAELNE